MTESDHNTYTSFIDASLSHTAPNILKFTRPVRAHVSLGHSGRGAIRGFIWLLGLVLDGHAVGLYSHIISWCGRS